MRDCLLDHPTLHVDGPSAGGRTGLTPSLDSWSMGGMAHVAPFTDVTVLAIFQGHHCVSRPHNTASGVRATAP